MRLTRNIYFILLISIIYSCKKEASTENNDIVVSGKLKSVIKSFVRTSNIVTVEYDLQNRVLNYNDWTEDSSFTPVKITSARYINYKYENSNTYPSKSIITNANGAVDSLLFFYNTNGKLIRQDLYNVGTLFKRTTYNYINSALIVSQDSGYNNGNFYYKGYDSLFFDNNNSITAYKGYDYLGYLLISCLTDYGSEKNPFHELNIFKYLYLSGDLDVGFNSKYNFTSFKRIASGTADHTITQSYNYSSNSFPVSAVGRETYNINVFGYLDFNTKYNYY